ncbi:MAG: ribosome assembly factor SBDS [Candidatus Lokiarchaeota archaeon]|nr:ribosome assembly factor SBDS [Candidatus Lokiarchaeota archaeon]MBD3199327.1 ribosome assembly factor SBDS [Candidatus Lokiarchaeota archaeon]
MIDRARIDLGNNIIGRIEKSGRTFEMLLDPEKAWNAKKIIREEINQRLKDGKKKSRLSPEEIIEDPRINLELIFESFIVFEDLRRGKKATDGDMEAVFQTTEGKEIGAEMLLDGDIQWTRTQREEEREKKLKKIINIISKNAINPQNKKPHPPERIEKAIEEANVKIDLIKNAEEQVGDVVKQIRAIIPIKMEQMEMAVKIPTSFTAKGYNIVAQYAQIKKEEWQSDGSWVSVISMPAGLQMELIDKLNKLTHGRVQTKLLKS